LNFSNNGTKPQLISQKGKRKSKSEAMKLRDKQCLIERQRVNDDESDEPFIIS
jgi:hypothetical protein